MAIETAESKAKVLMLIAEIAKSGKVAWTGIYSLSKNWVSKPFYLQTIIIWISTELYISRQICSCLHQLLVEQNCLWYIEDQNQKGSWQATELGKKNVINNLPVSGIDPFVSSKRIMWHLFNYYICMYMQSIMYWSVNVQNV